MSDKFLAFLGIAQKSGRLKTGFDEVLNSIKANKSKLVLFANDYSQNNLSKILKICEQKNIKTYKLNYKMEQLGTINKKLIGVITINDINFCKKINEFINESH